MTGVVGEVARLVSRARPWTVWREARGGADGWDGLVGWEVREIAFGDVLVSMWGADQMCYNWSVGPDGTPAEVVANCLNARRIDVEGGELWKGVLRGE